MNPTKNNPLIFDLLKKYQDDPTSRVFAPLAEAYRKAGMVDEAIEIARDGLRVHPKFMGGRVALGRALFDKKLYHEVVEELSPVVQDMPDNLIAQRLLAESCLMLGRVEESLNAFKMLLYFVPHDAELVKIVQELENQSYEKGAPLIKQDPAPLPQFDVKSANTAIQENPYAKKEKRIQKVEILLSLLQSVERYRVRSLN